MNKFAVPVTLAHAFLVAFLIWEGWSSPLTKPPTQRIHVNTAVLQPQIKVKEEIPRTLAVAIAPSTPAPPAPPPAKKPQQKKNLEQKPQVKPEKVEKPQPQKDKKAELFALAQENLKKVGTKSSATSAQPVASQAKPAKLDKLLIDTNGAADEESVYSDALNTFLRGQLKLPQQGSVKIKLTLSREGKVLQIQTVVAENEANKKYIEQRVSILTFPPFGKHFSGKKDNQFTITFEGVLKV